MLQKFSACAKKEVLILLRDRAGLAILFVMPLFLITIMSLVQDAPFRDYRENKIPIVYVDNDRDSLGSIIERGLQNSGIFSLVKKIDGNAANNENTRQAVARGDFRIGIIIPENATKTLNNNVEKRVTAMLASFGLTEKDSLSAQRDSIQLVIFFDPAAKPAFRSSVNSSLEKFIMRTEMETQLRIFSQKLGEASGLQQQTESDNRPLLSLKEIKASESKVSEMLTNSVQHNVPAWSLFAMFYIVIPLASSMIKERDEGSALRLLLIPKSSQTSMAGKIAVYVGVSILQFCLMIPVGIYILPLLGLPAFELGNSYIALVLMLLCCSLAATGFGFLVGSLFRSHHQAMTFGSVSVVILAALGGVLVPVYVMPDIMQSISVVSPLNWALNGINHVFLRQSGVMETLPDMLKLLAFSIIAIAVSLHSNPMKKYA